MATATDGEGGSTIYSFPDDPVGFVGMSGLVRLLFFTTQVCEKQVSLSFHMIDLLSIRGQVSLHQVCCEAGMNRDDPDQVSNPDPVH